MLAILTCHFNPAGYRRPKENYETFRLGMDRLPLFSIEVSFGEPFVSDSSTVKIHSNKDQILWQKEKCLNILLRELSAEYDKVAWVDADVLFESTTWYGETERMLDEYPVIQLFNKVELLDKYGGVSDEYNGAVYHYRTGKGRPCRAKPGYAWAARREVIAEGFMDRHIAGASDAFMLDAWMGRWRTTASSRMNTAWRQYWLLEGVKFYQKIRGKLNYIPGTITHLYHGSHKNRQYTERLLHLIENDYDPYSDIAEDENGLWRWNSDKIRMHEGIRNYLFSRSEDD